MATNATKHHMLTSNDDEASWTGQVMHCILSMRTVNGNALQKPTKLNHNITSNESTSEHPEPAMSHDLDMMTKDWQKQETTTANNNCKAKPPSSKQTINGNTTQPPRSCRKQSNRKGQAIHTSTPYTPINAHQSNICPETNPEEEQHANQTINGNTMQPPRSCSKQSKQSQKPCQTYLTMRTNAMHEQKQPPRKNNMLGKQSKATPRNHHGHVESDPSNRKSHAIHA